MSEAIREIDATWFFILVDFCVFDTSHFFVVSFRFCHMSQVTHRGVS